MCASEMAAFAGIDLDRRRARGADAFRIVRSLLVAFDHRDRNTAAERLNRPDQEKIVFPEPGLETMLSANTRPAAMRADCRARWRRSSTGCPARLLLAFGSLVAAGLPLMLTMVGLMAAAGSLFLATKIMPVRSGR